MSRLEEIISPFPVTRWSLVLSTGEKGAAALDELCRLYWRPLYTFARRTGLSTLDSEDVTQRFFLDLVEDQATLLREANPAAGKLRTLFLRVLQRRIADHHRHAGRDKRGGASVLSWDAQAAEAGLQVAARDLTPEAAYDRQWALSVLHLALHRLEKDFASAGREAQFAALAPFLGLNDAVSSYGDLARTLQITETAARQSVHRFRERFRRHLREEIAETLTQPSEAAIDHELTELRAALVAVAEPQLSQGKY